MRLHPISTDSTWLCSSFKAAENYRWFATNVWYNEVCRKSFGDPIATQDEADQEALVEVFDEGALVEGESND